VDYEFFCKQFCFAAYIVNTNTAQSAPKRAKTANDLTVAASELDLQAGTVNVQTDKPAKVLFVYYNAAHASREHGVLATAEVNGNASISYTLPALNGKYYFAAIANDDFYFFTAADAEPLEFVNGVLQNAPVQGTNSVVDKIPNAYTPQEIKDVFSR
jgi:hypothetical protein